MSNPIFDAMGNMMPQNNMLRMVSQFRQFQNNFRGDPQQQVQQLLNTGKMSQSQFNQLAQMANQFQQFLK